MISISKTIRKGAPTGAPFLRFYEAALKEVLGKDYELSLVFIGNKLSKKLNGAHRGINKPTDILSFTLDKKAGEIFINVPYSKIKCKKFDKSFEEYVKFILVHGLFHLKGYEHGSRMEREEHNAWQNIQSASI